MKKIFSMILTFGLWTVFHAAMVQAQSPADLSRMKEITQDLNRNYRYLQDIRSDLNLSAMGVMNSSPEQLNYIQRAGLFVDTAKRICFYQWRLLSITEYIREEARSDFYTLRAADLKSAVFESNEALKLLKVYEAFIQDESAVESISEAKGVIEANLEMFNRLRELIKPYANAPE